MPLLNAIAAFSASADFVANTVNSTPWFAPYQGEDGATLGYEGETYSPNPHEFVIFGSMKTPGIAKVQTAPSYAVDVQKAAGRDFSTLVLRGYKAGEVNVEVMVWRPEQWRLLVAMIAIMWRRPNKAGSLDVPSNAKNAGAAAKAKEAESIREGAATITQSAFPVVHPDLAIFGIEAVTIVGMSLEDGPQPQTRILRIRAQQYVPPGVEVGNRAVKGTSAKGKRVDRAGVAETAAVNAPGSPPSAKEGKP